MNRFALLRRPAARYLAGIGSALFPGVGQLIAGRPRLAALFALPVVAGIGLAGYHVLTTGRLALLAELASPTSLAWLLVLQAAVLCWRVASLVAALLDSRWPALRRRDAVPVLLLCAFAILPQVYAGYVTNAARDTATAIFRSPEDATVATPPPAVALPSGSTPPAASSSPTPIPTAKQRITVLLIGTDSEPGRTTALTDTLIVASFDPIGGTVSMVSVPRDLVDVPLPNGAAFQPKINSLLTYAQLYPATYPSPGGDPHRLLEAALGGLLGVHIDYYAQVNLPGFVSLVNAVGGVDVNVAHGICDPGYHDFGLQGFLITAGPHHLDGAHALGYARVRKAYGESDFTRAARQQEVIVALKDAIERGGFLRDPLGFLAALRQTVQTNVPPELLPGLVGKADAINGNAVYRAVIQPPLVHSSTVPDPRGSIQLPDLAAIHVLGEHLFPAPGTIPDRSYAMSRPASPATPSPGSAAAAAPSGVPPTPAPGLPADSVATGRAPICPAPATPTPTPSPAPTPIATHSPAMSPTPGPSAAGRSPTPSSSTSPGASAIPNAGASPAPSATPAPPAAIATPSPAVWSPSPSPRSAPTGTPSPGPTATPGLSP